MHLELTDALQQIIMHGHLNEDDIPGADRQNNVLCQFPKDGFPVDGWGKVVYRKAKRT